MEPVPLTTFVDFVAKSGAAKMTVVRNHKTREKYDPRMDYWKPLREAIVRMHQYGASADSLADLVDGLTDQKKVSNYRAAVKAYTIWLRGRQITWFEPTRAEWGDGELRVIANPEMGLRVNGQKYLIKLYFRQDRIVRGGVDIVCQLMYDALSSVAHNDVRMAVLDVRRSALQEVAPSQDTSLQLTAEAAYWNAIYPKIGV